MLELNTKDRQRFEGKVMLIPFSSCHWWLGWLDKDGYGGFNVKGKKLKAHRISHHLNNGPIPEGDMVLHSCDNPACVNPDHLWTGSAADNNWDRSRKGRSNPRRGRDQWKGVLTDEDVADIRAAAPATDRHTLAERYGVTPDHISRVIHGRRRST